MLNHKDMKSSEGGSVAHDDLLRVVLDDCSLPGFVSGTVDCFGSAADVDGFVAAVRAENPDAPCCRAWDEYAAGNVQAATSAAYRCERFATRARVLAGRELDLGRGSHTGPNTWGFDYTLHWVGAHVMVLWVSFWQDARRPAPGSHGMQDAERMEVFARCSRFLLRRPWVEGGALAWVPTAAQGHPGLVQCVNGGAGGDTALRTRLYLADAYFESEEALLKNAATLEAPSFQRLLLEVLGDG